MKDLYINANSLKFIPNNLSIGWKNDSYLWMCELQKWLRDKHNCIIEVLFHSDEYYKDCFDNKNDILYQVTIDYYGEFFQLKQTEHSDYNETHLSSYEEGLEIGVYKALNLIKNGNKD